MATKGGRGSVAKVTTMGVAPATLRPTLEPAKMRRSPNMTLTKRLVVCRSADRFDQTFLTAAAVHFFLFFLAILFLNRWWTQRTSMVRAAGRLHKYRQERFHAGDEFDSLTLIFIYQQIKDRCLLEFTASKIPLMKNILTQLRVDRRLLHRKMDIQRDIAECFGLPTGMQCPYYGFDSSNRENFVNYEKKIRETEGFEDNDTSPSAKESSRMVTAKLPGWLSAVCYSLFYFMRQKRKEYGEIFKHTRSPSIFTSYVRAYLAQNNYEKMIVQHFGYAPYATFFRRRIYFHQYEPEWQAGESTKQSIMKKMMTSQ